MRSDHARVFAASYTDESGGGSSPEYTAPYRAFVERFIWENDVRSILDLGCGDMQVMGNVDLQGASYVGVDCIAQRIEKNRAAYPNLSFELADVRDRMIEGADLVLVKDVIQHWPLAEVVEWFERVRRAPFKYMLVTNDRVGGQPTNTDIELGAHRHIDPLAPPFDMDGERVFHWNTKEVVLLRGKR